MLLADVAETTVFLMLPVLLGAGLGSLLVAALDTARPSTNRSIRLVGTGFAVVLALDSVLLVLYAMGEDTYYGGGVLAGSTPVGS